MRIVQSPDGMVKVVELDPTKTHAVILDPAAVGESQSIRLDDGAILLYRSDAPLSILEGGGITGQGISDLEQRLGAIEARLTVLDGRRA